MLYPLRGISAYYAGKGSSIGYRLDGSADRVGGGSKLEVVLSQIPVFCEMER